MASPSQLKSLAALREAFPELKAEAELNKAYAVAYDKAMVGVPLKERPTLEQWKATTLQTAPTARFQGALPMEHTKSSGQDASTQPVDSQWRAALRSYLAGTAGLPGDLEGLARQGINAAFGLGGVKVDETPAMPTTEFYKDWLPGKQEGSAPLADAASMLGGAGMLKGIRSVESLGKAVGAAKALPDIGLARQAGVIRATGDNNFLKGSVENALAGLKGKVTTARLADYTPAQAAEMLASGRPARNDSLNKFVEGPLTRYVKQQMATPDDPVRALAEQGILHVPSDSLKEGWIPSRDLVPNRGNTLTAKSATARDWENAADYNLVKARPMTHETEPWMTKDTVLHEFDDTGAENLGFTHLTDELRNALNPESGLPRNLLLTPEKMANMGMERAVRHVAAINDWREQAALTARKAAAEGIPVRKEHEGGFRWLSVPDTAKDEKALQFACDVGKQGGWCTQGADAAKRYGSKGNQLHVLVDAKGDPHVQIMTADPGVGVHSRDQYLKAWEQAGFDPVELDSWYRSSKPFPKKALDFLKQEPPKIVEIKGNSNSKPKDEYLPFVQDFVKSGKWSDVGDYANTGLKHGPREFTPAALENLSARGIDATGHMTPEEYEAALGFVPESALSPQQLRKLKGFATGGRVSMIHPAAAIQPLVRVPGFDKPVAMASGGSLADYVNSGTPVPMSERDPRQKNAYDLFKDHVNELNDKAKVFNELQAKASEEFRQTKSLRGPYQDQLTAMLAESYTPGGMGLIRNQLGKWVNTTSREVALDTAAKANAIEKEGVAYLQSLPADLRQALKDHGIRPVNGMLRGDNRAKAEALDQAFYNAPQLPKGTLLYRGENAAGPMADFANVHERFPYYLPTSLDIHTAKGFKKLADDKGTLNMVVPTGDTQYLLPGKFDTELEVLLPRHGVLKSAPMKAPPSVDKVLSYDALYASGGSVALKPKQGA